MKHFKLTLLFLTYSSTLLRNFSPLSQLYELLIINLAAICILTSVSRLVNFFLIIPEDLRVRKFVQPPFDAAYHTLFML
jgi:hypothetical protein